MRIINCIECGTISAGNTEWILERSQECARFRTHIDMCICLLACKYNCKCNVSIVIDNGIEATEKCHFPSFVSLFDEATDRRKTISRLRI